jgi:hypothetical protein
MRRAISAALTLAALLLAPDALAFDGSFTTLGMSMAVKLCCGDGGAVGFGPALNYAQYLSGVRGPNFPPAVGAFAWMHYYPSLDSTRIGLGPQASYLFGGIEVGPSLLIGQAPTHVAASITPFASIGFVWLGLRANLPAAKTSGLELIAGAGYPIGAADALVGN